VVAGLVAFLPGCAAASGRQSGPVTSTITGVARVTGEVSEDFPCTALKPILARSLEFGVDDCKAVPLTITSRRGGKAHIVYDLWVVTGNQSIDAGAGSDVVDFYERVTLGEVGDVSCGRFELQTYSIAGRAITVLARQVFERTCDNG
jgi:hypothetical protein